MKDEPKKAGIRLGLYKGDVEDKRQVNADITARDLAEFKRTLKIGARFVYESFR